MPPNPSPPDDSGPADAAEPTVADRTDAVGDPDEPHERIAGRLVALFLVSSVVSMAVLPPVSAADALVAVLVNALVVWYAVHFLLEAPDALLDVKIPDEAR